MTVEPFTPEQTAAIRAVIDAEVDRRVREHIASLQPTESRTVAFLRGLGKSWTAWTGALLVAAPQLLDALAPIVAEQWGPDVWKRVLQVSGVVMILLRVRTTQSLTDKGASS